MEYVKQVPDNLMIEINHAYATMTTIRNIVEIANNAIASREISFDECKTLAETAHSTVVSLSQVIKKPYRTVMSMNPDVPISKNILEKIKENFLFADKINELLTNAKDAQDKDAMRTKFRHMMHTVQDMEERWKIIHDYAEPKPQEVPHRERFRGGRKHRTHRERTHRHRKQKRTRRNRGRTHRR
jgi:hypothetical protein